MRNRSLSGRIQFHLDARGASLTPKEIAMNWPRLNTRPAIRRRRTFQPSLEQAEGRLLLSASGAITSVQDGQGVVTTCRIAPDHSVWEYDSSGFHSLGGYARSLSAGLDGHGKAEVFVVGGDQGVYVNDQGSGWLQLGGLHALQVSATIYNQVYAIDLNHGVAVNDRSGSGWHGFGGYASQIASDASNGVFVIGGDGSVYQNSYYETYTSNGNPVYSTTGWSDMGGYAKQLSVTDGGQVYVIGGDNSLYHWDPTFGGTPRWDDWGGYVTQISANDRAVYAIGGGGQVYRNSGQGWQGLNGYATALCVPGGGTYFWDGDVQLREPPDEVIVIGTDGNTYEYDTLSSWHKLN
jgi:hypothetical protein